MTNIKYTIHFYSPWHCSSGLSAGANADLLVIKNRDGMPYIPGKTLKGLIREAVEDYSSLSNTLSEEMLNKTFGLPASTNGTDKKINGTAFFTNAELNEKETGAIVGNNAQRYLFNNISSTAIGKDGIAKEHSLRCIETVVPCTLYAEIYNLPDNVAKIVEKSIGLIHHIGLNRNRGLGRCDIKIEKETRYEDY